MRRLGMEAWAGIAMLAVSIGVAAPAIFGATEPLIPRGWWIVLFAALLASISVATLASSSALRVGAFSVAVLTSWAVVSTEPSTGLLHVLLVAVAATSVYIVPVRVSLIVVALNTVVVVLVVGQSSADGIEMLIFGGFYLLIQSAAVLSTATLIREQRLRRELAEAHVELKAASILLSESARTAERLRISRELHDLLGHQLTVLTLELETARHVTRSASSTHIDRADRVARDLLRDVRATVGQLRTDAPDVERAIREIVDGLPGLAVSVDVTAGLEVGEEQGVALIRAVQEIVTNTLRHADARTLRVTLVRDADSIHLDAHDDGSGSGGEIVLGNGLQGLRERFDALGGDVVVDGAEGFRITARIPAS